MLERGLAHSPTGFWKEVQSFTFNFWYASGDASLGSLFRALSSYGLQTIFRFYSYGLEKSFEMAKWQDFQDLVLSDISFGNWCGHALVALRTKRVLALCVFQIQLCFPFMS